jgi:hypothetical protein
VLDRDVREHVRKMLAWDDAHVGFEKAVNGIPAELRGRRPDGAPYSAWELLEHLRRSQRDILDFCVSPQYDELSWPADYWPAASEPPTPGAWDASVSQFLDDRRALQELAVNPSIDLAARVPNGDGQTYLRELLLLADHTAYHLGELIVVRRLLGEWKS